MSLLSVSSSPYYLAFAAGGRPNACYSPPSPPPAPTPATPVDLPSLPPSVISPPPSPPHPPASSVDPPPSLPSKSSALPAKEPLTTPDSLYAKELSDSLPPALLSPPPAPPSASFPTHRSRGGYGQDAWYIDSVAGSALHSFGVADGVGGWRSQGVDSGIISRAVMEKCQEQAARCRQSLSPSTSATTEGPRRWSAKPEGAGDPPTLSFSLPSHILTRAYGAVKEEKVVTAGSTTACVLTVTPYRCSQKLPTALSGMEVDQLATAEVDPRSRPPSPRDFDGRHQLTAEDEQKEANTRTPSKPVPVPSPPTPPSFMDSDSDDDGDDDVDASFTTHLSPAASTASTDATPSASLSYKTASAFWNAVGHVITPGSNTSPPSSSASTPTLPASPMTSPPPSRPPSPSSPPLFLSCASLGDSGFLLLRHQRVIHRSDIQRTGRIVKQLAIIPPHLSGPQHRYCDDSPADAALSSHRIQEGDLIIVGSDGLLDNLRSSWGGLGLGGASGGFFVPWGRFLLGGVGGEDENDKEVLEKQNRKVESLVKECCIDWEARETEGGGVGARGAGGKEGFVRLLCDRLVAEASEFMTTVEGKPDDLTVLVLQVGKIR